MSSDWKSHLSLSVPPLADPNPCPSRCPVATFSDKTGLKLQTDCTDCERGFYCDEEGMTAGKQCPEGYICAASK